MRTADLHLQRSTETEGLRHSCLRQRPRNSAKTRHNTKHDTRHGIPCDDHQITNRPQAAMWHSRPGCDSAPHHALRQHYPFDEAFANRPQAGTWHSRPGCDFPPSGASKSAPHAGTPADLSLDTHPAYDLIDRTTRQRHGVLHGIQSDGKITEDKVYDLRDCLEHFRIFRGVWPFSDAFTQKVRPGMWHSRPGCDFAPPGASKSAPLAGLPVDHILEDNHVSPEELDLLHAFCNHPSERPTWARLMKISWFIKRCRSQILLM